MKFLGICGSVRNGSFNRGLLRAAQELAPDQVTLEIYNLDWIPLYDADVDSTKRPDSVLHFKQAIADADALLFSVPEYNASFSGVLKNAVDWASRPLSETPLMGKPAAMMGASGGMSGTARAQAALAPVLNACGVLVMPKPSVYVRQSAKLFDADGRLVDQDTRDHVQRLMEALASWSERVNHQ